MKTLISLILIATVGISKIYGQESCTEKLHQARSLYQKGQLKEVIELTNQCISDTVSLANQWKAYRLLTITYLDLDKPKEARTYAERLMELNPKFETDNETDPASFIRMMKSVKVIPKFGIGMAATLGVMNTVPQVFNTYNPAFYEKSYNSRNSWKVGVIGEYHMNDIISLHSGFVVASKKFDISYESNETLFELNENLTYLDVPIFARFYSKRFATNTSFFADAGIYTGYLLSSKTDYSRQKMSSEVRFENAGVSSISRRNRWEYGSLFGAGVSQKIEELTVNLDFKYYLAAFNNVTNTDARYKQDQLFYGYYYLDDDFRLNNFALSLSFIHNINYRVIKEK